MPQANRNDITSILGPLDEEMVLAILELRPTIADVEAASIWMSGDRDVFGAREPLKSTASKIVTLLTADEEDRTG